MTTISRRTFIRGSAGAVAAGLASPLASADLPRQPLRAATIRELGRTEIACSLLGMGTGVKGWNRESALTRKGAMAFVSLLEYAYAHGITYFDLADMYGSHEYMRQAMRRAIQRDRVMLLTKTVARDPVALKADLERFRRELDTDYIDIVLFHCLTEPGWTERMRGCMDVMEDAKHKGWIRAHGVSCHNFACMEEAAKSPWVDVILARINPFAVMMDNRAEEVSRVLAECHAAGKGVLGMKIVGEGQLVDKIDHSLRYVLTLGHVDAITIGFLEPCEVDDTIARIAALGL